MKNLGTENDSKDAKFTQMVEKEVSKRFSEKNHRHACESF